MPYADKARNDACKKAWTEKHGQEYARRRYLEKRDEIRARVAARKRAHRDRLLPKENARARERYAANIEKSREENRLKRRRQYQACPEKFIARQQERRIRKRGGVGASVKPKEWREIVETFCGLCAYCLKPTEKPEREHIVAIKRGGMDTYDNVVPSCATCNRRKNARGLIQWLQIGGAQ
jgi:5-methylcytosine-specific restriction endonuclease McrA